MTNCNASLIFLVSAFIILAGLFGIHCIETAIRERRTSRQALQRLIEAEYERQKRADARLNMRSGA